MRRRDFSGNIVTSALIIAVVIACVACRPNCVSVTDAGQYSYNLARVKCKKQMGGGRVDIEVVPTTDVLKDPNDRVVFVCEGETVRWFTKAEKLKITVDFKDKVTAAGLFESGDTSLVWDPTHPGELKNETKTEVIDKLKRKELVAHAYSIEVRDEGGNVFKIDPHVIPMGNKGP